jgi:hypothetical protein
VGAHCVRRRPAPPWRAGAGPHARRRARPRAARSRPCAKRLRRGHAHGSARPRRAAWRRSPRPRALGAIVADDWELQRASVRISSGRPVANGSTLS